MNVYSDHIMTDYFGNETVDVCTCCRKSCHSVEGYSACCNDRTDRYRRLEHGEWKDLP